MEGNWNKGFENRFPQNLNYDTNVIISEKKNIDFDNEKLRKQSWYFDNLKYEQADFDLNKTNVLIVGNSHAKDTFNLFYLNRNLYDAYDFFHYRLNNSDSDPSAHFQLHFFREINKDTKKFSNEFFNSKVYKKSNIVIISSKYDERYDLDGLKVLIPRLKKDNKRVVIFGNTVEFNKLGGREAIDALLLNNSLSAEDVNRSLFLNRVQSVEVLNNKIKKIANENNIKFYDKKNLICEDENKECVGITNENEKIFYDYGHTTIDGARYLGKKNVS